MDARRAGVARITRKRVGLASQRWRGGRAPLLGFLFKIGALATHASAERWPQVLRATRFFAQSCPAGCPRRAAFDPGRRGAN